MKQKMGAGLFVVAALFLVFGLTAYLPKYAGFIRILFFFLILDAALWYTVRRAISGFSQRTRICIGLIYWSPVMISAVCLATGFVVSFFDWPIPVRTYLVSIVLILFLVKLLPAIAWIFSLMFRYMKILYLNITAGNPVIKVNRIMGPMVVSAWIAGFIIAMIMVGGMIFGQFAFHVARQEISIAELPESFNGFKIVHVSDIHLGSWTCSKKLADAVDSINGLKPDVVFFTGDMFNYNTAEGIDFGNILMKLTPPHGIYAILGNHDYGDYITWSTPEAKHRNMAELKLWFHSLGWKLLMNEHDFIHVGIDSIAVVGVENWGATARFQRVGDIDKARTGIENIPVQLLLSHDPSYWDMVISKKYRDIDITFSGHTHGGQVGISMKTFSWSPSSWVYPQWAGLYRNQESISDQYLYVNPGLGNIGYPGRIGILPEITLITLKSNGLRNPGI